MSQEREEAPNLLPVGPQPGATATAAGPEGQTQACRPPLGQAGVMQELNSGGTMTEMLEAQPLQARPEGPEVPPRCWFWVPWSLSDGQCGHGSPAWYGQLGQREEPEVYLNLTPRGLGAGSAFRVRRVSLQWSWQPDNMLSGWRGRVTGHERQLCVSLSLRGPQLGGQRSSRAHCLGCRELCGDGRSPALAST